MQKAAQPKQPAVSGALPQITIYAYYLYAYLAKGILVDYNTCVI